MNKCKWVPAIMVIYTFTTFSAAVGSESGNGVLRLDNIVVSATKTEKKAEDAPVSVAVITQADMKRRNMETVDDALAEIPGVFVKRSKGLMDSTSSVRLRGFNGDKYTLVLIDGQPLNDAYTGGLEWGALPVNNIERIEVIRGAASALYGGNAMGGVINIITQTPDKLSLEASAGYGTHNTRRYRFSAGNRFMDKFDFRIGYEAESTDGYATTPVVRSVSSGDGNVTGGFPMNDKHANPKWVVGDKGDNGAERMSVDVKAGFDYSDTGRISFSAIQADHEYDYGRPHSYMGSFGDTTTYAITAPGKRASFRPNDFISYTGIGDNETDTYTLAVEDAIGPVTLHFQAGTVQVADSYTLESGSGMADYYDSEGSWTRTENKTWFTELRGDIPVGDTHLLTLGASYRIAESDTDSFDIPFYRSFSGRSPSTFYAGGEDRDWAVFAQNEWRVCEPFTFYVGARFDSWHVSDGASGEPGALTEYKSNTETAVSPKVAAVWKPFSGTTVRGSAGHAFRAPTLYELYRSWQSGSTTYESNPNLDPETVWAYELGIDQYLFEKRTRLSVTAYYNDIEDLIYYKTEGSTKSRVNAGEARTYGVELDAAHRLFDWLSVWGNLTWTDAKIDSNPTDPVSEGKRVAGIPETAWNLGLDADYRWFKASVIGRYFSKIYNDSDNQDKEEGVYGTYEPSFIMDAKITAAPWKWGEVSLSVNNIFDEEDYQYYQTDGCTVLAEMTLRY